VTAPTFLVLPYPPSANRYWRTRVVTPKGRAPFVSTYVSEEAEQFKADLARRARLAGMSMITGPVELAYTLFPHRPLDWDRRARRDPNGWQYTVQCIDLGNAHKVLEDALRTVLYEDDKWIQRLTGTRAIPDQHGARVVVAVRPWRPEPVQPGPDLVLPELSTPPARRLAIILGGKVAIDAIRSPQAQEVGGLVLDVVREKLKEAAK